MIYSLVAGLVAGINAGLLDALLGLALYKGHFASGHISNIYLQELLGLGLYLSLGLSLAMLIFILAAIAGMKTTSSATQLTAGTIFGLFLFALLETFLPAAFMNRLVIAWAMLALAALPAGWALGLLLRGVVQRIGASGLLRVTMIGWGSVLAGLHVFILAVRPPLDLSLTAGGVIGATIILFLLLLGLWFVALNPGSRAMISAYLLLLAALWLAPLALFWPRPAYIAAKTTPAQPLNIILIVADACRADALSIYGGDNQTPNLDRLAKEGALFSRAYSQSSWTIPSMLSMMSSLDPFVLLIPSSTPQYVIPGAVQTLAEALQEYGYYTEALVANMVLGPETGIQQGFDKYTLRDAMNRLDRLAYLPVVLKWHTHLLHFSGTRRFPDITGEFTERVLRFLDAPAKPFYIWMHLLDPHDPYDPPSRFFNSSYHGPLKQPFAPQDFSRPRGHPSYPRLEDIRNGPFKLNAEDRAYVRGLYEAEVRYVDEAVGKIAEALRSRGLDKSTLLVFTSDHGEEFWDHGDYFHGQSLYEEQIHVPLILWGHAVKPSVIDQPVALLDLMPTLREMAGLDRAALAQGQSLAALLHGETIEPRTVFAGEPLAREEMHALLSGQLKLIAYPESRRFELFDLERDPGEHADLFRCMDERVSLAAVLRDKLQEQIQNSQALREELWGKTALPAEGQTTLERLRGLGYVR